MIRVRTASRLHFGFLGLSDEGHWPDGQGNLTLPARAFGSVGLMIKTPGVCLTVEPSAEWSASGPMAERVLHYAARIEGAPHAIRVEACAPEHCGLGTGTQLALAVGRALTISRGEGAEDAMAIARILGRGKRSAIGIHGFERGGFLVDGGQDATSEVAPLLVDFDFPVTWRVLLVIPEGMRGLHGTAERQALGSLQARGNSLAVTDALCRLVLLGMLPALVSVDVQAFGAALTDFNARVGNLFAPAQGGTYAHPRLAAIVDYLQANGAAGVGQSSWGPTLFAVVGDQEQAERLAHKARQYFDLSTTEISVVEACNHGALVTMA